MVQSGHLGVFLVDLYAWLGHIAFRCGNAKRIAFYLNPYTQSELEKFGDFCNLCRTHLKAMRVDSITVVVARLNAKQRRISC